MLKRIYLISLSVIVAAILQPETDNAGKLHFLPSYHAVCSKME